MNGDKGLPRGHYDCDAGQARDRTGYPVLSLPVWEHVMCACSCAGTTKSFQVQGMCIYGRGPSARDENNLLKSKRPRYAGLFANLHSSAVVSRLRSTFHILSTRDIMSHLGARLFAFGFTMSSSLGLNFRAWGTQWCMPTCLLPITPVPHSIKATSRSHRCISSLLARSYLQSSPFVVYDIILSITCARSRVCRLPVPHLINFCPIGFFYT